MYLNNKQKNDLNIVDEENNILRYIRARKEIKRRHYDRQFSLSEGGTIPLSVLRFSFLSV